MKLQEQAEIFCEHIRSLTGIPSILEDANTIPISQPCSGCGAHLCTECRATHREANSCFVCPSGFAFVVTPLYTQDGICKLRLCTGPFLICANNDDMVMAAARAAKGNAAYANTIFLGFNGDRAACEAILAGQETMSVIQDAYGMGYKAVEAAVNHLNGETVEEFVDSGSGIVDAETAQARLDELAGYLK